MAANYDSCASVVIRSLFFLEREGGGSFNGIPTAQVLSIQTPSSKAGSPQVAYSKLGFPSHPPSRKQQPRAAPGQKRLFFH
jgi:hypothetical protein